MSSSYRQELERWLATLDVKANRVLDIGGSQNPVKGRTKTWDVKEYLIADLPEPHEGSPLPDVFMNLNYAMSKEIIDMMTKFDLIFCLEVFEYIYNPLQAFSNIKNCLADGGTAWVTFPSFYPMHQPVEDDALRYMPSGIKKLAAPAGLSVVQMIKRRPETNALQQFFSAERLRAAKNEDHAFTGFIVELKK